MAQMLEDAISPEGMKEFKERKRAILESLFMKPGDTKDEARDRLEAFRKLRETSDY